jgi:hypothetical protein
LLAKKFYSDIDKISPELSQPTKTKFNQIMKELLAEFEQP